MKGFAAGYVLDCVLQHQPWPLGRKHPCLEEHSLCCRAARLSVLLQDTFTWGRWHWRHTCSSSPVAAITCRGTELQVAGAPLMGCDLSGWAAGRALQELLHSVGYPGDACAGLALEFLCAHYQAG